MCLCLAGAGDDCRRALQQPEHQEEVFSAQQPLEDAGGEDGRQGRQTEASGAAGTADGAVAGDLLETDSLIYLTDGFVKC